MQWWSRSTLFQMMASCAKSVKSLFTTKLTEYWCEPLEQVVDELSIKKMKEMHLKILPMKIGPVCLGFKWLISFAMPICLTYVCLTVAEFGCNFGFCVSRVTSYWILPFLGKCSLIFCLCACMGTYEICQVFIGPDGDRTNTETH